MLGEAVRQLRERLQREEADQAARKEEQLRQLESGLDDSPGELAHPPVAWLLNILESCYGLRTPICLNLKPAPE